MAKFELFKDKAGEFRFRLKAGNGEIILASEGYTSKDNCLNGIESVRTNCASADRYVHSEAQNGTWYFNLKAANGQVIGTSQMYKSKAGAQGGIESVMHNGTTQHVDHLV